MRKRVRIVLAVLVVAGIGFGAAATGGEGRQATGAGGLATASVEVRDLVDVLVVDGALGFGEPLELAALDAGVVTAVASEATVVQEGGVLAAVNLAPTILLEGTVPAWRPLDSGSDDGADITQLEQALVDLGYGPLKVDDNFTSATAAAVKKWEKAVGRPEPDGRVELGDVVFRPGPVRVASVEAPVGASVAKGATILAYTATAKKVSVELDADNAALVKAGNKVTVTLPGGATATAEIATVGAAAAPTPDAEPTVPVTAVLTDPSATPFETGSVKVAITRERRDDVPAVPVSALVALSEGGYAVETPDPAAPSGRRLIAVQPGLYADGWVQVTGDGIAPGLKVVVPS